MSSQTGRRVLFLNWRDLGNPLGGGSERYLHEVARRLAAAGDTVTVRTAAYDGAPAEEVLDGVRYVRGGTPNRVFAGALADLRRRRFGRTDVVVDCQNGVPFWCPLVVRCPIVVLVHHVHRELWPVAVSRVAGRLGWWLESRVAPRVYRRSQYVAVSGSTRDELQRLGVQDRRIAVVPNGVEPPADTGSRAAVPTLAVLGRLVPHKQVEHALEVLDRLSGTWPDLRLTLIGDGYWRDAITDRAEELGLADRVDLLGHVDEEAKHRALAAAWVHLFPSVKEGWGIAVLEAAQHGVPTVAYRSAGGTVESVQDGVTGLLADDLDELVALTGILLSDDDLRERLGSAGRTRAEGFTWDSTASAFAAVLDAAVAGRRVSGGSTAPPVAVPPQRLP